MTCEPHVRRELEAEAAAERAAVLAELDGRPAVVANSPYPDPAPVVDPETATVTARVR